MAEKQKRSIWQHFYRLDGVIYTFVGSAIFGVLMTGHIPHTVFRNAFDVLITVLLTGTIGLTVGAIARLITAAISGNKLPESLILQIGNICAFLSAPVVLPILAVA